MATLPEPVERVARVLRDSGTEGRVEEFLMDTPTAEDAARAAGTTLEQIVKSLVFVCDGRYVLAMVPGDRRADGKRVAEAAGAKKARVAGAEQVEDATGFTPGAVAPFPLRKVETVLIERRLLRVPARVDRRRLGAPSRADRAGRPRAAHAGPPGRSRRAGHVNFSHVLLRR